MQNAKTGTSVSTWILMLLLSCSISNCKKDKDDTPRSPNLQLIAENLASPLSVVEPPDGSKRLFVVDQTGKIYIVPQNGTMLTVPFMDISNKITILNPNYDERGLLSMAFHPAFQTNGKFYVFYTAPPNPGGPAPGVNWNNLTRISEFKVSATDPNKADMTSERIILEENHPQGNHNGGTLAFGPDGYLYISIGDGGASNDDAPGHVNDWYDVNAGGNAQNIWANLMGKVLRIDVNTGNPYSIPADNPFANSTYAKREIYAFGLRNPYRFSFDMGGNNALYLGDAGQGLYEEVNIIKKGGNYGWNVKEGTVCFNTDDNTQIRASCPSVDTANNPLENPLIQIKNKAHPDGDGIATVVVGGNVYRGDELPHLKGQYIFGIFSQGGNPPTPNGKLFIADPSGSGMLNFEDFVLRDFQGDLGYYVKGFGQDLSGEIYVAVSGAAGVSGSTGKIFRLVGVE